MTTRELSAAVIAERQAHGRLMHFLRTHGSPKSRIVEIDKAFAAWRQLADILDKEGADAE